MVSFVIIDYKSCERTVKFVGDLYEMAVLGDDINIVVVDNSLDDSNFEGLKRGMLQTGIFHSDERKSGISGPEFETRAGENLLMKGSRGGVLLIRSLENGGYAKGNNLGALASRDVFGDDYIIFSNNDIIFERELNLKKLLEPMEREKDVCVTGPRIVGLDGELQSPHKKVGIWKMHIIPYLFWPAMVAVNRAAGRENVFTDMDSRSESGYAYRVMGSFMAVRASSFFEVGMFDEKTFLYGEEMILSERLKRVGGRSYYVHECSIVHEHGASTEKTFKHMKAQKMKLDSSLYYHREYLGASSAEVFLARLGFSIYERIYFPLRNALKKG